MNLKIVWLVVAGGCLVGFGSGLLIGRSYPAHGYQKYGETRFMLDTATGKLCDPFKDPSTSTNLIDQGMANAPSNPADPFDKYAVKPTANYPPACGK